MTTKQTLDPNIDFDEPGAVRVLAAEALSRGQIVTFYKDPATTRKQLSVFAAGPDNVDTGAFPLVMKHNTPQGEQGIALPWLVWYGAYAHWFDAQIGLDSEITAQPVAASVVTVVSDSALDVSVPIVAYGLVGGQLYAETITTDPVDGTTPVDGLLAFTIFYGFRKPTTDGTITITDDDPATIAEMNTITTTRGLVAYNYDVPDDGLSFVADGATTAKLAVVGTIGGVVTLKLITLAGAVDVPDLTEWDHIDYIAYGAVAAARTVTVRGTRDLTSGPLYLDPDHEGWVTMDISAYTGSHVVVGYVLNAATAFMSPTPANWTGMIESVAGDIDAVQAALDGFAADLVSTTTDNGAALVGIEDAALLFTATNVEIALQELATRVGDVLVKVTLTPAAEASNHIDVTINVTDLNNIQVNRTQRLFCQLYDAAMLPALVAAWTMAEIGAGTEVTTTLRPAMMIQTDAIGDAIMRVNDVSTVFSGTMFLVVTPLPQTAQSGPGTPAFVALTFV